ncbi:MAG: FAD-dependent oxidoreductase, partial [Acetobacter papayae]
QEITAERIVIATGATPTRPSFPGVELAITSDEAFALPQRPDRVALIGAGYIGIEFAGIFAGLGAQAELIYRHDLPLRGFDEDMRTALADAITVRGITQHRNASPESLTRDGTDLLLRLNTGETLRVDCVFLATGRHPKTAALGLEQAGIKTAQNGRIVVDGLGETSCPGIYAIGDVTDRINLTPVAIAEGHTLADQLFGKAPPREWDFATTPKAVFFSPPLACTGLTEEEAARTGAVDIYLTRFTPMRHTLGGRRERKTVMKLVVDQASQVVVGAHILGDDAPEMLQAVAIAVTAKLKKADFDRTIGIHPTSAEELVTLRTRTRKTPHPPFWGGPLVGATTPPAFSRLRPRDCERTQAPWPSRPPLPALMIWRSETVPLFCPMARSTPRFMCAMVLSALSVGKPRPRAPSTARA